MRGYLIFSDSNPINIALVFLRGSSYQELSQKKDLKFQVYHSTLLGWLSFWLCHSFSQVLREFIDSSIFKFYMLIWIELPGNLTFYSNSFPTICCSLIAKLWRGLIFFSLYKLSYFKVLFLFFKVETNFKSKIISTYECIY